MSFQNVVLCSKLASVLPESEKELVNEIQSLCGAAYWWMLWLKLVAIIVFEAQDHANRISYIADIFGSGYSMKQMLISGSEASKGTVFCHVLMPVVCIGETTRQSSVCIRRCLVMWLFYLKRT